MAATEECAQRACFRIADVTVMHSVTTRATGLTATVIGRGSRSTIVSWSVDATWSSPSVLDMAREGCGVRVCMRQKCGARRRVFMVEGSWTAVCLVQST